VGLGQLCWLKDIEMVDYYGFQDMRMMNLEWMLQHRPHLQSLSGDRLSNKRSKAFGNQFVRHLLLISTFQSPRVGASVYGRGTNGVEFIQDQH
jgi:hypothetical protein